MTVLLAVLLVGRLCAAAAGWQQMAEFSLPASVTGALSNRNTLLVWGDGLWERRGRGWHRLAAGGFSSPGCLMDDEIILQRGAELVAIRLAGAGSVRIDTDASLSDCRAVTLFGRPGLLVAHRGLQVRFYERGQPGAIRWPYREIYSFYTASYQAGLLLARVDQDTRPDIFCGNYWIQAPEAFALPWRLFAINTYHDTPAAARFRLALRGRDLIASQGWVKGGKLLLFSPPADVRQLWTEQLLSQGLTLDHPSGLVVDDLDADGVEEIYAGEAAGQGRIFLWAGGSSALQLGEGLPIVAMLPFDWDRDGQRDLVVLGWRTGRWYRRQRLK